MKPVINRFDIKMDVDGDVYVHWTSGKGGVTRRELIDYLKRFVEEFEPTVVAQEAKQETPR